MTGIWLVTIPLLLAAGALGVPDRRAPLWGKICSLSLLVLLAGVIHSYANGSEALLAARIGWVEALGINLSFRIDGIALLMVVLVLGIGSAVFAYASDYLKGESGQNRFLAILMTFLAGMLGVVVSGNLIQLFVFWELTSLTSYLLIGHYHEQSTSRWHALQALLVTGCGGVVMFLGFLMIGHIAGTYEIGEILEAREVVISHPWLPWMVGSVLFGAFTKSGQFPFHFWIPNAMSAPTPVSAFLHSATMVKAGVFLVAVMTPLFGGLAMWDLPLILVGGVTMLYSATLGLLSIDLKKILAYTTLSVLGLLMMLLGVGSELAIKSAVIFLFGHALYKSTLFMCAGSIAHAVHTRDVRALGGLLRWMPLTAVAAGLSALSSSGFPPFVGFIGKEYVYKSGLAAEVLGPVVLGVAFLTNMALMALAFKVGVHPFFARKPELEASGDEQVHADEAHDRHHEPHDPSLWMALGPLFLAIAGLAAGMVPGLTGRLIVQDAVTAVAGYEVAITVKLWHGLNPALLMSGLTLLGGIILYRIRWLIWNNRAGRIVEDPCETLFERGYHGLLKFAGWQTRVLQSGSLRNYFYWILGTFILLSAIKFSVVGWVPELRWHTTPTSMDVTVVLMLLIGAVSALVAKPRFVVLLSLGLVGFGVAWIYAAYGAPDLAITQILVETLMVVLFVFAVRSMPKLHSYSSSRDRLRDGLLAVGCGTVVTLLVLKTQLLQISPPISGELMDWSYTLAKGRNVVNVILVDFRALDTMGEVTVLSIAAAGVYVLLGPLLARLRKDRKGGPRS